MTILCVGLGVLARPDQSDYILAGAFRVAVKGMALFAQHLWRVVMGEKGSQLSSSAVEVASALVDAWSGLGDVTFKKMFGGCGIFISGKMFALVDSSGTAHLKADEELSSRYLEAGSVRHGRMPYYSIPDDIMADKGRLKDWATASADLASRG